MQVTFARRIDGGEEFHKAGCKDLVSRRKFGTTADQWTEEHASKASAAKSYWSDFETEWEQAWEAGITNHTDSNTTDGKYDFGKEALSFCEWGPCLNDLPLTDPQPEIGSTWEQPLTERREIRVEVREVSVGDVLDDFDRRTVTKVDIKPVWYVVHCNSWNKKMHRNAEINVTRSVLTAAGEVAEAAKREQDIAEFMAKRAIAEMNSALKATTKILTTALEHVGNGYSLYRSTWEDLAEAEAKRSIWATVKQLMEREGHEAYGDILKACQIKRQSLIEGELMWYCAASNGGGQMGNALKAIEYDTQQAWVRENYGRTNRKGA